MLVNLTRAGRRTSFLKIKVALEVPEESDIATVELRMPRLWTIFRSTFVNFGPRIFEGRPEFTACARSFWRVSAQRLNPSRSTTSSLPKCSFSEPSRP